MIQKISQGQQSRRILILFMLIILLFIAIILVSTKNYFIEGSILIITVSIISMFTASITNKEI